MAHAASAGKWHDTRQPAARGWGDILPRVKERISRHRLSLVAAGVAYYSLMAIFPALVALVGIYGLVFDPQQVATQVSALGSMLPPQGRDILLRQLQDLTQTDSAALGIGAIVGMLLALWSASAGVRTIMEALNVAYGEDEKRGIVKFYGIALLLTLGAIIGVALIIALLVAVPVVVKFLGAGALVEDLVSLARWPVVVLAVIFGLAVLYRFAPSRNEPRWKWLSRGAVFATVLWLLGSVLFSIYVNNFASYNKTYGAAGAVVILLTWFLLSAYVVLIGAEINAESETSD